MMDAMEELLTAKKATERGVLGRLLDESWRELNHIAGKRLPCPMQGTMKTIFAYR